MILVECVRIGKPVPLVWGNLSWYVATVRHGHDQEAREELEAADVPVFMMEGRKTVRHRRSPEQRRRQLHVFPVFPGYLFVGDVVRAFWHLAGHTALRARDAVVEGHAQALLQAGIEPRRAMTPSRLARGHQSHITGFIGEGVYAARVNGAVMQDLFVLHESGYFVPETARDDLRNRIRIGDVVEIREGPMRHMRGVVNNYSGDDGIDILTQIFGRETRTRIPLDFVRVVDV